MLTSDRVSYLCVGGPLAGQQAESDRETIRLHVLPRIAAVQSGPVDEYTTVEYAEYRKQKFKTPEGSITLWAPSDQSPQKTLEILLETYAEVHCR